MCAVKYTTYKHTIIAKGGVIYSPGSAGTMQEIFQYAAQNHYRAFGYESPMVFLDIPSIDFSLCSKRQC